QHLPGERRGGRQRTVRARRDRERHLQILAADHEPALQQRGGRGQADQHGTGLVHRDPQILDLVQREPQPGRQARRGGPEYPQVRAVGGHREQDQVAVERWLGRRPWWGAHPCLVSQKIFAISSILASSLSPISGSAEPFAPLAPASLVASLKSW